jgi:hypothetical protein
MPTLKIDSFDGFTHSADLIQFDLTNVGGTWASAANVLTANGNGAFIGAHIFIANLDLTNTGVTGFTANGGAVVPDGGTTVMLLGAALGALGLARRFLRS